MNKSQRKQLNEWKDQLEEIKSCLETMQEDETEKLDNMPESLQESERGEAMQEAIENLESASSSLEEAIDYLNEIVEGRPMDEITIKVTMAQADRILEALKYRAANTCGFCHDDSIETYNIVKRQIESQ